MPAVQGSHWKKRVLSTLGCCGRCFAALFGENESSVCTCCVCFRKAPVPTREGIPTCGTLEASEPEVPQGDHSVQLSDGSLQSSAVELHTPQVSANEEAAAVIDSIINENQTTASNDSFLDRCVSTFREATPGRIIPCHRTMALEEVSLFLAIHGKYLSSIRQPSPTQLSKEVGSTVY